VLTGGAGARAMSLAFEDVFGVRDGLKGIPFAGRTDAWILSQAATAHGVARDGDWLARVREIYLSRLAAEVHEPGPRKGVMPGVRELLAALSRSAYSLRTLPARGPLADGSSSKLTRWPSLS